MKCIIVNKTLKFLSISYITLLLIENSNIRQFLPINHMAIIVMAHKYKKMRKYKNVSQSFGL